MNTEKLADAEFFDKNGKKLHFCGWEIGKVFQFETSEIIAFQTIVTSYSRQIPTLIFHEPIVTQNLTNQISF